MILFWGLEAVQNRCSGNQITSGNKIISVPDQTLATVPVAGEAIRDRRAEELPLSFRWPVPEDGPAITALIARCPPLDVNSAYCNLVQCAHFADTCVVAERDGEIVGWISGHRPPGTDDQLFVWQVAVDPSARGLGLGGRMLDALFDRAAGWGARVMTTTITADNAASWALFTAFARRRGLSLSKAPLFEREAHFAGAHDTEWQATIGPLHPNKQQSAKELR